MYLLSDVDACQIGAGYPPTNEVLASMAHYSFLCASWTMSGVFIYSCCVGTVTAGLGSTIVMTAWMFGAGAGISSQLIKLGQL